MLLEKQNGDVLPCQVSAVLAYSHQNVVEPFLEPVLGLCQALLDKDQQEMHCNMEGKLFWAVLIKASSTTLFTTLVCIILHSIHIEGSCLVSCQQTCLFTVACI